MTPGVSSKSIPARNPTGPSRSRIRIFPMRRRRKTKILATLGPASNTRARMHELFDAGVDVFRINMSHTSHDMLKSMVSDLRALADDVGRPIGILCDLQGPKIRLGKLSGGPRMLV